MRAAFLVVGLAACAACSRDREAPTATAELTAEPLLLPVGSTPSAAGSARPRPHLPPVAPCTPERGAPSQRAVTVKKGMTLDAIATEAYGNRSFALVLGPLDGVRDEARLRVGATLATKPLAQMFSDAGFAAVYLPALRNVQCAVADYRDLLPAYEPLRPSAEHTTVALPEEMRERFAIIARRLEDAQTTFAERRPAAHVLPKALVGKLGAAAGGVRMLGEGRVDGYGYDIDMVFQDVSWALRNAHAWMVAGYK